MLYKNDNIIINLLLNTLIPVIMIFGLYIHLYGDYTPGGGFQSGVIFAIIFILYKLVNITTTKYKQTSNKIFIRLGACGVIVYITMITLSCMNIADSFVNKVLVNTAVLTIIEAAISIVVMSSISCIFNALLVAMKANNIFNSHN